jgi:hypothetical protein
MGTYVTLTASRFVLHDMRSLTFNLEPTIQTHRICLEGRCWELHKTYGLAARVLPRRQPTDDYCLRQRYVLLRNRSRGWGCKYAGREGENACAGIGGGRARSELSRRRVLLARVCPTGVSETDKYISEHVMVVMPVQLQLGVRYAAPDEQRADVRFAQLRITVRLTMHIISTHHTHSIFFHQHVSWARTSVLLAA